MKIQKRILGNIERVYSLALIPAIGGKDRPSFAAGSEGEGGLMLFKPPDYKPKTIAREPGGFMSICPFQKNSRTYLLASTNFKPGFKGENCRILLYPLDEGECPEPREIVQLPYTHRISIADVRRKNPCLFASTLCASKDFKDDWSHPGGVHLAVIPDDIRQSWTFRQITSGLSKNHGMDFACLKKGSKGGFLLSTMEGLFYMGIPDHPDADWPLERISEGEHSDACAYDWNDMGHSDIFSLSPFHGNILGMHTRFKKGWGKIVIDEDIEFGHITWAGDFLGQRGLIVGCRGGRKELRLYRSNHTGFIHHIIDEGISPTQLLVVARKDSTQLIVAGHAKNEVLLYEISP